MLTVGDLSAIDAGERRRAAKDPDNRLFSRMNRLRLEGEAVRDTLLAVSGRLNPKAGGPGVVLPERRAAGGGARPVPVTADPAEHIRRSVYLVRPPQPPATRSWRRSTCRTAT